MAIRAITFDWWGTLFQDVHGKARQEVRIEAFARAAGIEPEVVAQALEPVWAEFNRSHRQDQRTLCAADAVRMTAETLAVSLSPQVVQDLAEVFASAVLVHAPEPVDHALDAVRAAAAVVPVGIISDTGVSPGRILGQIMDKYGFTSYFSAMTWSDELDGLSKPREINFTRTANLLAVSPHEMLHIGDLRQTDIAGAKNVGAKSGLFTGINHGSDATIPEPDYEFETWPQFIRMLPQLMESN